MFFFIFLFIIIVVFFSWKPPKYLQDLPEADRNKLRAKFNIIVDGEDVPPPAVRFLV